MAMARLINPFKIANGTGYRVEVALAKSDKFTGPDDTDWTDFLLVPGVGASFQWRTGADRVRAVASKVAAGTWTVARALKVEPVADWVSQRADDYLAAFEDEQPELRDLSEKEFAKEMLVEVGQYLNDEPGGLGFFDEDDDSAPREAAECLELPAWAKVRSLSAGGPGSGYSEIVLVITEGKNLQDLAEHMAGRV